MDLRIHPHYLMMRLELAKKLTLDDFVRRVTEIHGDKYDYSEVSFRTSKDTISIRCKKHEKNFSQTITNHLYNGMGCPDCGNEARAASPKQRWTPERVAEEAIRVHDGKYTYPDLPATLVDRTLLRIQCKQHGEFSMVLSTHFLRGGACPQCNQSIYLFQAKNTLVEWLKERGAEFDDVEFRMNLTVKDKIILLRNGKRVELNLNTFRRSKDGQTVLGATDAAAVVGKKLKVTKSFAVRGSKEQQLGDSQGNARNRLQSLLIVDLLNRLKINSCHRCGDAITPDSLSFDHIQQWMSASDPVASFYSMDNIAFSHLRCNCRHTSGSHGKRTSRDELLGHSYSTARNRLRVMVIYDLYRKLNALDCFRCGEHIASHSELSLDHKTAWLNTNNPQELYFDVNNLAASHKACNVSGL
jgi:hypothetical protein